MCGFDQLIDTAISHNINITINVVVGKHGKKRKAGHANCQIVFISLAVA